MKNVKFIKVNSVLYWGEIIFTSDKEIILSSKVENAVNEISNAGYGIHYLIIYSDLVTLREFYSYYVQKQIEERNELVQIASFYENEDAVRQTLCECHRAIDVKNLEQEKSLVVVDSLKKYFYINILKFFTMEYQILSILTQVNDA